MLCRLVKVIHHYRKRPPSGLQSVCWLCGVSLKTSGCDTQFYKRLAVFTYSQAYKAWDFDNAGKPVKGEKSLRFNSLTDSIEVIS
jgi:hypothetical protein